MTHASRLLPPDNAAGTSLRRRATLALLPPLSSELPATTEAALDAAMRFMDRLVELRLRDWLAVGRRLIADREGLAVRQRAWMEVDAAIGAHGLALAAWHMREALETAAFLVSQTASRWTREERRQFAATQGAAEAAALALLAQTHTRTDTVRTLWEPFASMP